MPGRVPPASPTRPPRDPLAALAALAALQFACAALPPARAGQALALTPPMGWNDWAHYQCHYTAETILANARALVRTGLAARGYDTVTIDDCWMRAKRGRHGELEAAPKRFPHGMRPVIRAVHALGLKFGIYEDAGYATCGGFAGSGRSRDGGPAHFTADARRFAAWGVDYLKLDGCNVYAAPGQSSEDAFRQAYRAEHAALQAAGRPIVFSESAPAYFQGTPDWYNVLSWVHRYGQLWREGSDIATYHRRDPDRSRFASVLWNYTYNLPLGRFQSPGHWNDADFIIGGDPGLTLAETRSQLALWSMMSAPLILSSDLDRLRPAALAVLGDKAVIAVDQDPLGRMATLIRRTPAYDVLLKPLQGGRYAAAVLNRGPVPLQITLRPHELGFAGGRCHFEARDLWSGATVRTTTALRARIAVDDTAIWRLRPTSACAPPRRTGAIVQIVPGAPRNAESYSRCLTGAAGAEACGDAASQSWSVTAPGQLRTAEGCLSAAGSVAKLSPCRPDPHQRWRYTLRGDLINRAEHLCLTAQPGRGLTVRACGHNLAAQIWSLPNPIGTPRTTRQQHGTRASWQPPPRPDTTSPETFWKPSSQSSARNPLSR